MDPQDTLDIVAYLWGYTNICSIFIVSVLFILPSLARQRKIPKLREERFLLLFKDIMISKFQISVLISPRQHKMNKIKNRGQTDQQLA